MVCTGAKDPFNPPEKIDGCEKAMNAANADYEVVTYSGAEHSFTNPGADSLGKKFNLPLAYNKAADEKSWEEMKNFFNRIFSK